MKNYWISFVSTCFNILFIYTIYNGS